MSKLGLFVSHSTNAIGLYGLTALVQTLTLSAYDRLNDTDEPFWFKWTYFKSFLIANLGPLALIAGGYSGYSLLQSKLIKGMKRNSWHKLLFA